MTKRIQPPRRYKNAAFQKALGAHCKKLRIKAGYSIDRMYREGECLGPGTIQRLETGSNDVHVSVLLRYAQVLDIEPAKLLSFKFNWKLE
ncbi:MAG: hypothetical protein COT73_09700 [Bdellovibrio sp. CG10_big_fil_rev_8_21_14_0_10_47_8]|nr:MAG: hypothetical protein COT73_09700 [Bdellovibrio sp. CG10_big_fil_rev_8_21_14_0_10_47_8]